MTAILIKDKAYFKIKLLPERNGHKRIKVLIQQMNCGG